MYCYIPKHGALTLIRHTDSQMGSNPPQTVQGNLVIYNTIGLTGYWSATACLAQTRIYYITATIDDTAYSNATDSGIIAYNNDLLTFD